MKILHVIDTMDLGGAQQLVKGIFENYPNPESYLFVLRKTKNIIPIYNSNLIFSKAFNKYSLKPFRELKNFIKKNRIDIIHCHLLKSQIFGYFIKLLFFRKAKIIFHEHGEVFINQSFIFKAFMKNVQKCVNKFIATSEATKNELIHKCNIENSKIKVVYNYVKTEDFERRINSNIIDDLKQNYNFSENDKIIGFAGRLSKEKGCIHLINAIPFIKTLNIKVLIAGKGDEESILKNKIDELNIRDKVVFLGYISDMKSFYHLLDLFVIPSEHESFGLTAIEAQLSGIPVIASDIPGLNEVVIDKKTGFLFENKNSQNLANKIDFLLNDNNKDLKIDITKQAIDEAKKYNIDKFYQNLLEIYNQI